MDWKVIDYDLETDSMFLTRGSQLGVNGIRKLEQMVVVRLVQGLNRTGEEYDVVAGGLARLVQQRIDVGRLKSSIKILVRAVKSSVVNEQARQSIPDSEKLTDMKLIRMSVLPAEVSIEVMIQNAEGGSAVIAL